MGCASGKATKVTDNAQKPPQQQNDFSNINPQQQQLNGQPLQNQQFQNGRPMQNVPFQNQQQFPLNGQPYMNGNNPLQNPNQTQRQNPDEEYGEEDGEEDYDEELEEDEFGNATHRNGGANSSMRKTKKSQGGNTFHDTHPVNVQQMPTNPSEKELIQKQQQMKNNIDSMKKDLTGANSSPNMIGMFKESVEKKSPGGAYPIQQDLSSAIDAYQKQMRDFKNSLTDMDKKLTTNPLISPSQFDRGSIKLDKQPIQDLRGTLSTNPNNNNRDYGDEESATYNSISQTSNNRLVQKIDSYNLQEGTNFKTNSNLINNSPQKSYIPLLDKNENLRDIGSNNFHRQGTQIPGISPSQTQQQNKVQTGPVPLHQEEDDELNPNNKYYNFDNGYQKSEISGKNYKAEQSSINNISLLQKNDNNPISMQNNNNGNNSMHESTTNNYRNVQRDKITIEELNRLKDEFLEQEERERLNPQNMLLRILMIHSYNDAQLTAIDNNEEMYLERKLYSFFINKNSNIIDIKSKIRKEFGFDVDQLHLYFKYQELASIQYIMDVDRFDIEEDIIICISVNAPKTHLKVILREPLDDIKIADVRFLNSRDRSEPAMKHSLANGGDFPSMLDMNNFDTDQEKLSWPFYRDWTAEAAYLSDLIIKNKNFLLSDEQQFMMQQGFTQALHSSQNLAELVEAETQYRRLADEFRKSALYAVHLVVRKNPTPLNLFNLYGDDGDKYIVGGMLIRRAKDWTICGHQLNDMHQMTTTIPGAPGGESGSNLIQISGKIASLDVRNMSLLRNRLEQLVVPLACVVDYYGLKFQVQSLSPISINSLAYGSDLDGLLFTDHDPDAEMMAQQIAFTLNLKMHFIEEKTTNRIKRAFLPYTVQLHRNRDMGDADKKFYLVNPFRLFPQDESLRQQTQQSSFLDLLSKQLRAELVINNNKNEPAPNYDYFSWKKPVKCDECGMFIVDYQYYYFEKRSVDKQSRLLVSYYCCLKCYTELLPTERFKYPINKIVFKELPTKDRLEYWQNRESGKRYYDLQYKKISLNPDAFMDICNTKDKAEKIYDQEEILRAGQKLKDEVLGRLIEELNNVDEDPLSSEQLE